MHIIIIGCGKVGCKFAQVLSEEGHDVVIVDSDHSAFNALEPGFGGITVTGVPIDQDVLKQAGIENADALAAVTPDDNINIMVSQVAKEIFKVPKVVARIYNPAREHVFHEFGLETVCPTNITVNYIRSVILSEEDASTHTIGSNTFSFRNHRIAKDEEGKKLGALKVKDNSMLFGVTRNGDFMFPDLGMKLEYGDIVVFAKKID